MKRSATIATAAALVLLVLMLGSRPLWTQSIAGGGAAIQSQPRGFPFTFVGYGDIRFTDPANRDASDPERRQALVRQIAADKPDFVLITGDLVYVGSNAADWRRFDRETESLRQAGVRIVPVLGNHDVRGGEPALDNYFRRFPELQTRQVTVNGHNISLAQPQRWYSMHYGNCLFLILDSDTDHSPASAQGQWLKTELADVPRDVDFVFVAMHHPPYTQSSEEMGGHSARPDEQPLAQMLEQRQSTLRAHIIAIAGHVHNYERYQHGGVTYIVSGGGGATPYKVRRNPNDFYREDGPTYHYCTFTVDHGKLSAQMHKLEMQDGQPHFRVADSFELRAK